jgi:hypothetical protein
MSGHQRQPGLAWDAGKVNAEKSKSKSTTGVSDAEGSNTEDRPMRTEILGGSSSRRYRCCGDEASCASVGSMYYPVEMLSGNSDVGQRLGSI